MLKATGKFAVTALGLALVTFGALWTLLEPLGGFEAINDAASRNAVNYATLCIVSLAIGVIVALVRYFQGKLGSAPGVGTGDSRLNVDFLRLLGTADERIVAVGISLPTYSAEPGLRVIGDALRKGISVDLVFVNPLAPAILQRPQHLYDSYEKPALAASASLRACLRFRDKLGAEDKRRFRIHLTNVLPNCAAVIVDDTCYWHPYLTAFTGVNSPYLQGPTGKGFARHVFTHVEEVIAQYSFEPVGLDPAQLAQKASDDPGAKTRFTAAEKKVIESALSQ